MGNKLYLVGQCYDAENKRWAFGGVFDDYDLAVAACHNDLYFVNEVTLNEVLPVEIKEMNPAKVTWPLR